MSRHWPVGISLYVFAVCAFLLPSVSMGVVTDQGDAPGHGQGSMSSFQQPNVASMLGQLKLPGQKNEESQNQRPKYVPGEVLVKFRKGVDENKKKYIHEKIGTEILSEIRQIGVQKVKSKYGKSAKELLDKYKSEPDVLYVEPNVIYQLQAIPNDPEFSKLWGLHNTGQTGGRVDADIDAPEAWDILKGDASVIVAVIDSGVDYTHPDLAANMVPGWDFMNNDSDPMDDNGHGTHVAGTIAAKGDNSTGVVGVSWHASIMPLKICDAAGNCDLWSAAQAVLYAANHGAKVANNSWGGLGADTFSQTLLDAINVANQSGMLFVAAAGNDRNDNDRRPVYPCNYVAQNVICVAASFNEDAKIAFSNYGAVNVDLAAPGVNIFSTVQTGGYAYDSGTSMAAPHVAGAAVLAVSRFPALSPEQVKNLLVGSVDTSEYFNGTFSNNIVASGGRLNVNKALRSEIIISALPVALSVPAGQSTTTTITVKSINNYSGVVTLSIALANPNLSGSLNTSSLTVTPGSTATATLTISSTAGMAAGNHAIVVQGRYTNSLGQTETRLGTVGVAVQTDLAVTVLTGPSNGEAGGWFAVSDSVQNQGTGLAKEFYVGYYLSTDNIITESDVRIGSRWIPSLATGATNTQNMDVWVPSTMAAGTYYLGVIVADIYQIPDANTGNNSLTTQTITISSGIPASAAWVNRHDGPVHYVDFAKKVIVDNSGNSIVTGHVCKSYTPSAGCDFDVTTIKYSPDGAILWTVSYDSGKSDNAVGLAIDEIGNIYVTMASCTTERCTAVTIKYDSNGNVPWPTPAKHDMRPSALTTDNAGNTYITGDYCNIGCFIVTAKFDSTGIQVWESRETALSNFSGGRAIAVDSTGNVYIAADEIGYGYGTIKYGPNGGTPRWKVNYMPPGGGGHYARALALDSAGNVYVSGLSHNDNSNYDIATVKYDNNGNQRWVNRYDNGGDDTLGNWDTVFGQLMVDAAGNVYIAGVSSNGLDDDFVTIKYDTSGNPLWTARHGDSERDIAYAMTTDESGNVYLVGSGRSGRNYTTIKYGVDGHPRWYARYDSGSAEMAFALAVDGSGNIYVTGTSDGGSSSQLDYATVKYTPNAPVVNTEPATSITLTCATLNGRVNPNNRPSTVRFEWGPWGIYSAETADKEVGSGTTPVSFSQQICGLTPNSSYGFRAIGTNSAGTAYGEPQLLVTLSDLVAPDAPSALTVVDSVGRAGLSWTAANDNSGVLAYYRIERCTGKNCTNFGIIDSVQGSVTSYQDYNIQFGTTYRYQVRAEDYGTNTSAPSNIVKVTVLADTVPPTTPANLTVTTAGMTQINLNWTASTDNVLLSQYYLERCAGVGCSTFDQIGFPTITSYTDTGLVPGTSYSYRVRARDVWGLYSDYSNTASATLPDTEPPGATTGLMATFISSTRIDLNWTQATDNSGVVAGYKIERCTGTGCTNFAQIATSPTTSYSDTGLTGLTTYCYQVRAYDAAANDGPYSSISCSTTPEVDTTAPSAPASLTATAVSKSQVNLSWPASTDNVGVTGYEIERCIGLGCTNFALIATVTGTSYSNTGLTSLTDYRYRVKAYDSAGNRSNPSPTANVKTPRR